jgi:hypothetical protein
MAAGDPLLTPLQARMLHALWRHFSPFPNQGGMTYKGMMEDATIGAKSLAMLQKTIGQLRGRSRSLITSYTLDRRSGYPHQPDPKGRRRDVFTLDPTNILTDAETAAYIDLIMMLLPISIVAYPGFSNLEIATRLVTGHLYRYRSNRDGGWIEPPHRDTDPSYEYPKIAIHDGTIATEYNYVRNRISRSMLRAYRLGYLTGTGDHRDLLLSDKALSEAPYLKLLGRNWRPWRKQESGTMLSS